MPKKEDDNDIGGMYRDWQTHYDTAEKAGLFDKKDDPPSRDEQPYNDYPSNSTSTQSSGCLIDFLSEIGWYVVIGIILVLIGQLFFTN